MDLMAVDENGNRITRQQLAEDIAKKIAVFMEEIVRFV